MGFLSVLSFLTEHPNRIKILYTLMKISCQESLSCESHFIAIKGYVSLLRKILSCKSSSLEKVPCRAFRQSLLPMWSRDAIRHPCFVLLTSLKCGNGSFFWANPILKTLDVLSSRQLTLGRQRSIETDFEIGDKTP
jgi:hypothetical protein